MNHISDWLNLKRSLRVTDDTKDETCTGKLFPENTVYASHQSLILILYRRGRGRGVYERRSFTICISYALQSMSTKGTDEKWVFECKMAASATNSEHGVCAMI